jgi:polyhydroxyalkanoate synthase subunit PhaC
MTETIPPPSADLASGVRAILDGWGALLAPVAAVNRDKVDPTDKRFAAPEWDHPVFDLMRQGYAMMAQTMMAAVDAVPGDDHQKAQMTFAMRTLVEAMSPANSPLTNPVALNTALETNGASIASGFRHLMADLQRGQLTHTDAGAFEVGRNIATTPGKVIHETPLYQLIQYTPTTPTVGKTPLVIFPPWINRFYILDLSPEKSFIRWAVAEELSVFMVSWKSADASMGDVIWDDYVAAQIDAINTVRSGLDVESVHAIGYCVAGTTLAATLAVLTAQGMASTVKSATFFTAQVDFSEAGELLNFVDDANLAMIDQLSGDGFLDGRYLAMTFNMLRGKDLIWNTVVSNYLLGKDYPAFDLLHWNGDTTNLPAKWHKSYLTDLYRDNRLVVPGALSVLGVPIDLTTIHTPAYVQAGREDHIAPAASVWKLTENLRGPVRFVLAGSGHIAGVVNPPTAQKYQHWINAAPADTLADFIAGSTEHRGSWWPDWIAWIRGFGGGDVTATGARSPGEGKMQAIEDAPGRYVKMR